MYLQMYDFKLPCINGGDENSQVETEENGRKGVCCRVAGGRWQLSDSYRQFITDT